MLEYITIESDDKEGEEIYRKIIYDVLSGFQTPLLESLYVKINVKEGYFIISAIIKKNIKPMKLSDLRLEPNKDDVMITIDPLRERFVPPTLQALASNFGKEKIIQPSRYKILIKDVKINEIEDLVIFDHANYAKTMITEILFWIAPEQFKITRILKDENRITILFSEYNLKDAWLEEMQKIHTLTFSPNKSPHASSGSP